MATQRERYAVQFQITESDNPEMGIIASLNALGIEGLETFFSMSENLFLRKVGKAMAMLQDSELSQELKDERASLEGEIADSLSQLADLRAQADKNMKEKRALLKKAKFSPSDIDNMLGGLAQAQETEWQEKRDGISAMQERITAIDLTPISEVNSAFLDGFARIKAPNTGNGNRAINSEVHVVHFENTDYYVAVETPDNWRIYDKNRKLVLDSTQCPNVVIGSRTKARKVCYILNHDTAYGKKHSYEAVNKVTQWKAVNSGGIGANGDLIELHGALADFAPA